MASASWFLELGSGGPLLADAGLVPRASASYLVWIDGRGKVLVDLGGGAFLRFGQSTVRLDDLSLIAISHLHPDHVSDRDCRTPEELCRAHDRGRGSAVHRRALNSVSVPTRREALIRPLMSPVAPRMLPVPYELEDLLELVALSAAQS